MQNMIQARINTDVSDDQNLLATEQEITSGDTIHVGTLVDAYTLAGNMATERIRLEARWIVFNQAKHQRHIDLLEHIQYIAEAIYYSTLENVDLSVNRLKEDVNRRMPVGIIYDLFDDALEYCRRRLAKPN